MPYINVSTTKALDAENRESIKKRLGEMICIIPGKSEEVLMIRFDHGACIYYSGREKENAAYVDIRIHGNATVAEKSELTVRVFEAFKDQLAINNKDMFVTISEFANWGFQGKLV